MCFTFRVFFMPINVKPETIDLNIMICCCLQNFLRKEYLNKNSNNAEGLYRNEELPTDNMIPLAEVGGFAESGGFEVFEINAPPYSTKLDVQQPNLSAVFHLLLKNDPPP
ncbi:hypothetical protein J437_LFUL015748 [Ladona fulva]|uniref:Uncharacterized protein n=1 Tax=Ladona fulva TaxID=123851 RepID=A0A8K0KJQ4_LADFU|nr:hypothetical protein J437_LFUL015748 [Ladona fulva]